MLAKDVMRKPVVAVRPETTLRELAEILDERGISGVPVVGPEGDLIGVVSQTDLVRRTSSRKTPSDYHQLPDSALRPRVPDRPALDGKVDSVMTPWVVSFEEDTPVEELARQMLAKRIHRVVITREGRLSGIVTALDLLRGMLKLLSHR